MRACGHGRTDSRLEGNLGTGRSVSKNRSAERLERTHDVATSGQSFCLILSREVRRGRPCESDGRKKETNLNSCHLPFRRFAVLRSDDDDRRTIGVECLVDSRSETGKSRSENAKDRTREEEETSVLCEFVRSFDKSYTAAITNKMISFKMKRRRRARYVTVFSYLPSKSSKGGLL